MSEAVCSECGAPSALERGVLFDEPVHACMACGHVRAVACEVEYSDNPHVDPRVVAVREVPLDEASRAWVSELPRKSARGMRWIPASARAADAKALEALEAAAPADDGEIAPRLRAAGIPGRAPTLLSPALAGHREVVEALAMDATTPIARLLGKSTFLARRVAEENLAARPNALVELASSLDVLRPEAAIPLVAAIRKRATPDELDRFAGVLGERLAPLVGRADDEETAIDAIVSMLAVLGPSARRAAAPLRALTQSSLYTRRSTLRDLVSRALA
jgi:hypothetical protein